MSRYLDEYSVGEQFESLPRTITETDVVMFACMTGDMHPNHTSEVTMKDSMFGRRIAHGLLGLAYSHGPIHWLDLVATTAIAFVEIENWKFHKPIFIGDSVTVRITVKDIIFSKSKSDRGVIKFFLEVMNQDGVLVQSGIKSIMMKRKPADNA